MKGRVLICISDPGIAELVALEAELLGIEPVICDSLPKDVSGCGVVIHDGAVDDAQSRFGDVKKIVASNEHIEQLPSFLKFEYPFLLEDIRGALIGVYGEVDISSSGVYEEDMLIISDRERRLVRFSGRDICLSQNEFIIFDELYRNSGEYVERERLDSLLKVKSGGNMTDVYICHLRRKFEGTTGRKIIYTARDRGYMINLSKKP